MLLDNSLILMFSGFPPRRARDLNMEGANVVRADQCLRE
jgi:hypothetical protein